jgi:hypothetical protein
MRTDRLYSAVLCFSVLAGATFMAGCARPVLDIDTQLAREVPSGEGVVVIMDPMSCSVNRDVLAALDSISQVSGIAASAVLLRMPPSREDREAVVTALHVTFPVRWDTTADMVPAIKAAHYSLPIIAVVSRGALETVAWGHGFHAVAVDVANRYRGSRLTLDAEHVPSGGTI